ncbi:hypothetical protein F4861DRAFT_541253 [Xylaria intraflava]|nr:hypothetical protein F4861DRAFT_541253 [Xylaria intraflava]
MDPLSITTAVITLVGAANKIHTVLRSIRHANHELQSLIREVNTLYGFLRSVQNALEECRSSPYGLTHIDPTLWKESKIALSDCQETLDELGLILIKEPKRPSRSNTLFRRVRVAAELQSRAGDIASFREKISMSNLSLQTLLQVINVSLSLRTNESHDNILRDLKELKDALKKSSQAATASYSALFLNEHDTRLVHHLKGLLRAAQEFHASASTTASTVMGSGETRPPPTDFGDDDARSGCLSLLPSMKRRQIETFLLQNQQVSRPSTPASSGEKDEEIIPSAPEEPTAVLDIGKNDSSHSFSTIFTSGFTKIAQRALQQLDLCKAEGLLKEALKWYTSSGSADTDRQRRLQIQLTLCSLLQGNRQEAQGLIHDLLDSSTESDTVAYQLLYALALLQLHELEFEGARNNSKRLWQALQNTTRCTTLRDKDAMRILATSYRETGDSDLADAIEAEVPGLKLCEPVPRMVDFLIGCEELLDNFIGLQDCSEASSSPSMADQIHKLPIATKPSSLQMRQLFKNASTSLLGTPPADADDCASTKACPNATKDVSKAKRSWSNLRILFTTLRTGPRESASDMTADSTADNVAHHSKRRRQPSRLRKRVKKTHVAHESAPDAAFRFPAYLVSGRQNPIKLKWNWFGGTSPVMQNHDSGSQSRTMEWVIGQNNDESTDTTRQQDDSDDSADSDDSDENNQPQRQFSFRAGVSDYIPPRTSCYELANTAVIPELMDTSPRLGFPARSQEHGESRLNSAQPSGASGPKRLERAYRPKPLCPNLFDNRIRRHGVYIQDDPSKQTNEYGGDNIAGIGDISQRMEDTIYVLLGYGGAAEAAEQGAVESTSSESDSLLSSDFDRVTQSTSRTSHDSLRIQPSGADYGSNVIDIPPLSVRQQVAKFENRDEHRLPSLFSENNKPKQITEPEFSPKPIRVDGRVEEVTVHSSQPRSLEFTRIVSRLYHNNRPKPPRKTTTSRRRLPSKTIAELYQLFSKDSQAGGSDFNPSFNKSIYSGPDAVAGPFTDPGEMDLSGADADKP